MTDPSPSDLGGMRLERIGREHVRDGFDCGEPELDEYLRRFARQNDERDLSRTYVAVRAGERDVVGYLTLRRGMVSCDDLPEVERRRLPRYPIPVVHLARLAVHREAQGHGLGRWLLVHALEQVLRVAEGIAVYAVEVVAMSGAARTFYERYGFRPLQDDPDHLYLSIAAIRRALA